MKQKAIECAEFFLKSLFMTSGILLLPTISIALPTVISVNSSGSAQSFCNANSGSFCLTQVKREAQDDAYREAIHICEFRHNGRPRTYTISTNSICNPSFLPINHDGTWVRCRASARMSCEVEK